MTTPAKPRHSGIPAPGFTPGRTSGIPTPGRSRSSSTIASSSTPDTEYASRAFADAIKANDPALHRPSRVSDASNISLSPRSASHPQSGRRSVTGRPSSSASSSSSYGRTPVKTLFERSKTPSSTRPASRQSDVHVRTASRAGRGFEVGDNVRIESLGYEGTLRYVGDIEGKANIVADGKSFPWAGIELSGGFAGKGKNNGTVDGRRYFMCPPKCGIFVPTSKLSPPTVGSGMIRRPSSVTSSRSGRATPSVSGRVTPSFSSSTPGPTTPSMSRSNGRVTPSAGGRITPSISTGRVTPGTTPAARSRIMKMAKLTPSTPCPSTSGTIMANKITAGSRASKYLGMTAKQLSSRDSGTPNQSVSSMTHSAPSGSPTRPPASPFTTPKPATSGRFSNIGIGTPNSPSKGRPSFNTPRARMPSSQAMPPPASPIGVSRSISLNDQLDEGSLSPSEVESNGTVLQDKLSLLMSGQATSIRSASSRPGSSASIGSPADSDHHAQVERLQSRLDALEYENERLQTIVNAPLHDLKTVETAQAERDQARSRISQLESQIKMTERALNERDSKVESLQRTVQQMTADLDAKRTDSESRIRDLQSKQDDNVLLVQNLKEALEAKEGRENENDATLKAKKAEVALLQARVEKAYVELESERRELGAQVSELRQAGQETIALYEERLSSADSRRYELEDRISALEEASKNERSPSPKTNSSISASAAEIDNETLRDQNHHLQKKVTSLEDILEDARASSEREEIIVRERIRRFKEKEELMKKELMEGRLEVEKMLKSETHARGRVEEIEDALRESTSALEDARAEVEGLRAELANFEGANTNGASRIALSKVADTRTLTERTRLTDEIERLKILLNEQSAELESLRKRTNRDIQINNGLQEPFKLPLNMPSSPLSSKYDLSTARDEITGLKHIVQVLQKENLATNQRNKLLESENKLLLSETDQLRQELKSLEENLEHSIIREELALSSEDDDRFNATSPEMASLQHTLKEQKSKFEVELELLRKRLTESEMKNARVMHDLNKEISELEALVESKIYREDELEQEVDRLKDRLARSQKKSSKSSTEMRPRVSSTSTTDSAAARSSPSSSAQLESLVCEICEQSGHDIFNCPLLKDDTPSERNSQRFHDGDNPLDLFCEDCESHGHIAVDCPHSLDVF